MDDRRCLVRLQRPCVEPETESLMTATSRFAGIGPEMRDARYSIRWTLYVLRRLKLVSEASWLTGLTTLIS